MYVCTLGDLFSSNIVLSMPFSEDLSRLAARKYARVIQKLGFPVSLCTVIILIGGH